MKAVNWLRFFVVVANCKTYVNIRCDILVVKHVVSEIIWKIIAVNGVLKSRNGFGKCIRKCHMTDVYSLGL